MQKTLILGGGIGGIVASNVLRKIMRQDMQVTVVDRKPDYHFTGAFPLLMVGERYLKYRIEFVPGLDN